MKTELSRIGLSEQRDLRAPAALNAGNNGNSKIVPFIQRVTGWCLVVGTAVIDAVHAARQLVIDANAVSVDGLRGWEVIPVSGPRLQPGGKANAAIDLGPIATRLSARETIGGGGANTLRELGRLRDRHGWPLGMMLADTGNPSEKLREELQALRAEYHPLNLGAMGRNLVFLGEIDGRPARTILRGPVLPLAALNGEWHGLETEVGSKLDLVIINSPRSDEVAKAGVATARRSGALLISVLTPSTSLDCRLKVLLANSDLSIVNLAEFRELIAPLGIDCAAEREHWTSVPSVAVALSELVQIVPCGDVVITMGAVGQVIYDSQRGVICHVGLTDEARAICRNYLPAARINGIGDAFVAYLAFAMKFLPSAGSESSRIVHAARYAWMELLAGANPRFLHPHDRWFTVSVLATGLPARRFIPSSNRIVPGVSWAEQAL